MGQGHDLATGLQIAVALGWWRFLRGRLAGEYPLLLEAAGHAKAGSEDWRGAQYWLGWTASFSGDMPASLGHFTALRDAVEHRPPSRALADALVGRAAALQFLGQFPEADADGRRALALAREVGYPAGEALALDFFCQAAYLSGDVDRAVQLGQQNEQLPADDMPGAIARSRGGVLTEALVEAGDLAAARRVCAATLARSRDVGDVWNLFTSLAMMGFLDLQAGRTGDAAAHLHEALETGLRAGMPGDLLAALDWCGHLCARTGRPAEAVTMWAASAAVQQQVGQPDAAADALRRHDLLRQARQALGPDRARAAEDRGAAMSLATAAEYALVLTAPNPQTPAGQTGGTKLSGRERELVILVAQGRTNAQIAAQLFISVRTVGSHLDRIRDKTGCRRRADLTRLALQQGLI